MIRPMLLAFTLAGALSVPAAAQPQSAPFEPALMRLSELLGGLHYLRNLCGEPGTQWRDLMGKLIAAEAPNENRKAQFTASFNRGYRAFASSYSTCTESAVAAFERYRAEGEKLADQTAARFGN